MYRLVSVVVLFAGWINVGISQNLHHSIRNYTAIDGLPQSQVKSIVEDENGYLWLGTQGGGLARFDGREFKVYTTLDGLVSNFVLGIRIDSDKNIWILHPRGLTKFDGLTFTKVLDLGTSKLSKSFRRLFVVDNTVFVFAAEGLTKIKNDSIYYSDKPVTEGKKISMAFQTRTGEICFYMDNGQFLILKDEEKYTITPGVKEKFFNAFYHKDELWIQSHTGTYLMDLKNRVLQKLPYTFDQIVIYYDENEDFYLTNDRTNLYRKDFTNNLVKTDTLLQDVWIEQVLKDSEGSVWLASDGRGLFKYYAQDFHRCVTEEISGVMAIEVDREGGKWLGTFSKGLWYLKDGKTVSFYNPERPYRNAIHDIAESPDGNIWIATANGAGKFLRKTNEFEYLTMKEGLASNGITKLVFDEKGGLWIGTNKGINYFDGNHNQLFSVEDGLKSEMVWSLFYFQHDKTLFVGGEYGINLIKDGKVGTIDLPEFQNTSILGLHSFRDSLMIIGSAGSGIMVFDPKTYKRKLITSRDGLTSDFVYFVTTDKNDKIWIGTEKGITRLQLNDQWEIVENLHFDEANGLTGIETNHNAYYISEKNKYFGLVDGLYEFNDLSKLEAKSFDLHLTDVEIFYGDYSARNSAIVFQDFLKFQ